MSHKATMWAVTVRGISCAEARVLWHLADCHNPVEGCFPSQEYLAEACEIDERSVRRNLLSLKAKGLVNWCEQREGKYRKNNRYALAFEVGFVSGAGDFEAGNLSGSENGASTGQNCTFEPDISVVLNRTPESSKPVIEPVINLKAGARDRAPEEGGLKRVDRKRIEREFVLWFPNWGKGDVDYARNSWFALSDEERAECIDLTPAYLRWAKKSDIMAAAVYLKNRHWRDMPEDARAAPEKTHGIAKFCGKLWMGRWLLTVSQKPTGIVTLTTYDEKAIRDGLVTREALLRKKRMQHGWPAAKAMLDLARRHEPFVTGLDLLPCVSGFRQVSRDGEPDVVAAWQRLHERNGQPFPDELPEWLWMPALDAGDADLDRAVEKALQAFLSTVNGARGDDAA
jgi:hypothetical protein